MSKSESADWQDVERRGVTLIDKGHQFQQLGCDEDALASFDKAVTICLSMAEAPEPVELIHAQALDNMRRANLGSPLWQRSLVATTLRPRGNRQHSSEKSSTRTSWRLADDKATN